MSKITIKCSQCEKSFEKELKEFNRQLRVNGSNVKFFCTPICQSNSRLVKPVTKQCKCGKEFQTTTGSNHCSTSCASRYSLTAKHLSSLLAASSHTRFQSGVVNESNASALRSREWPKYISVDSYLLCHEYSYQFEYLLPGTNYIYDLAIFNKNLLIEFDEEHHSDSRTKSIDELKTIAAQQNGWKLHRINVNGLERPYSYELIFPFLYGM